MAQAILNEILDRIKTLELNELQQLNQVIQKYLISQEEDPERTAFHRSLLNSGLVRKIERSTEDRLTERRLIQVEGKPVSETLIEERR
ncbi:MAG: hypothetical protein KME17_14305 [Cyanosarcina radialis HA8281-LM2]|nr:hypothetical protein [Cyanosarcina radialis HA8281-LM2]